MWLLHHLTTIGWGCEVVLWNCLLDLVSVNCVFIDVLLCVHDHTGVAMRRGGVDTVRGRHGLRWTKRTRQELFWRADGGPWATIRRVNRRFRELAAVIIWPELTVRPIDGIQIVVDGVWSVPAIHFDTTWPAWIAVFGTVGGLTSGVHGCYITFVAMAGQHQILSLLFTAFREKNAQISLFILK